MSDKRSYQAPARQKCFRPDQWFPDVPIIFTTTNPSTSPTSKSHLPSPPNPTSPPCLQVAIITGGDSGIGRSVAVHFAREGADVAIVYLPEEQKDAEETEALVKKEGKTCLLFAGDVGDPKVRGRVIVWGDDV